MKKHKRTVALATSSIMVAACLGGGLIGCSTPPRMDYDAMYLNLLSSQIAVAMLGTNAYNWNVYSVDPQKSFGYRQTETPKWYSYSSMTSADLREAGSAFKELHDELKNINTAGLSATDMVTYRDLDFILGTYEQYYNSPYAYNFELMSSSYIDSYGGYVANFADMCENYNFRNKADIDNLLAYTISTGTAFPTYANSVRDRLNYGYTVNDYTLGGMLGYLTDILNAGDNYYLYALMNSKIDKASFLTPAEKGDYKLNFHTAIKFSFMVGVQNLKNELMPFLGGIETTNIQKSYIASYGDAGKKYYEWEFYNKTGIRNADITAVYNELVTEQAKYTAELMKVEAEAAAYMDTDIDVYNDYTAYVSGEKVLLDLTEPDEILDYLKEAAKDIVPSLKTMPEIDFKYMDETVAERSSAIAYYIFSPLDEENATEHITINGHYISANQDDLLVTLAHEGYPGHLYAAVNAKENGASLMNSLASCLTFGEGWAQYTELALLDNIAESTEDEATRLYCKYKKYETMQGYYRTAAADIDVNYRGTTLQELRQKYVDMLVSDDLPEEQREEAIRKAEGYANHAFLTVMEKPAIYIPYGYGMSYIVKLHDKAKTELGENYNEVEFNGTLLSEGFGPTLTRAAEITDEYINKNKQH